MTSHLGLALHQYHDRMKSHLRDLALKVQTNEVVSGFDIRQDSIRCLNFEDDWEFNFPQGNYDRKYSLAEGNNEINMEWKHQGRPERWTNAKRGYKGKCYLHGELRTKRVFLQLQDS
jgi:hypothetical protein